MTALDIAKEYFPDLPDDALDFFIWECTGYPMFWEIGTDGNTPEECFRIELQRAKDERMDYDDTQEGVTT